MQNNASFLMLEYPCMITRLKNEVREALREFRNCPAAYITNALKTDSGGSRRASHLRVGLAIALLVYAAAFSALLLLWSMAHVGRETIGETSISVRWVPVYAPPLNLPADEEDGGGGGGGGRETRTPPSDGELPAPSLNPIVGPTPRSSIHPPALPVIEAVMLDPRIEIRRDDLSPTGLPDGAIDLVSAGPGSAGGIGTGVGGGIGEGQGPGVGAGDDGGIGDGGFHIGGPRKIGVSQEPIADTRPVLLNRPQPLYTEEARKNKVQGVVRVRILVDEKGAVREVIVTRRLPDGLTEQAIRAAHQMRFRPAMKSGRAISYWISSVEIEFNLR